MALCGDVWRGVAVLLVVLYTMKTTTNTPNTHLVVAVANRKGCRQTIAAYLETTGFELTRPFLETTAKQTPNWEMVEFNDQIFLRTPHLSIAEVEGLVKGLTAYLEANDLTVNSCS